MGGEIPNYFKKSKKKTKKKNKKQTTNQLAISALLLIFDFPKMAKVKYSSGIIKTFHGDGVVVAWLKKVQLVVRFQKIDDVASFLPLYLEDDALQLYLEIDEDQQTNIDLIESQLEEVFVDAKFDSGAHMFKSCVNK